MKNSLIILWIIFIVSIPMRSQTKIYITANGVTKTATLVDNKATLELISLLEEGDITLSMTENGGFEKVGNLPQSLSTSDTRQTARSGDIMLYVGNVICIFYGSNTWAYTKLGKLENMSSSEIEGFLSGNPVSVVLTLGKETNVKEITKTDIFNDKIFDLKGNLITQRPLLSGIYIINGRKVLIK